MNTSHGVLTSEGIFHKWGNHYATLELENIANLSLEGLMHLALQQKFTHLWILPETGLAFSSEHAYPLLDTRRWDVGPRGKYISIQKSGKWKGHITSIVGRSVKPYTPNTRLIFVEPSNWPLDKATPEQILNVADKVESTLGVAMAGSPTSVGLRYLEKMNKRYYDHYFEKSEDIDWEELKSSHVPPFAWFPAIEAQSGMYLHCFDRNSSHPFAAATENMGVGTPYIQEGGEFDKKKVGLWDVEIVSTPDYANLPPLFPKGEYWLPTPILRIASIAGYTFKVNQAMIWPEGKPVFERWAKELWQFREDYAEGTMERKAIKAIMNNPIGATRVGEEMDRTLRPDWYATVLGSERAVVWYKAYKIAKESKVFPCGAYADALYYLSDESNPHLAVPGMLNAEKSLGGYKHVWTLPIDNTVCEVLSRKMGVALRIGALKSLVRAK